MARTNTTLFNILIKFVYPNVIFMVFQRFSFWCVTGLSIWLLSLASSVFASAAPVTASGAHGGWTLPEAVDFALENSPDIHIALQRLQAAGAMSAVAESHTMPTVNLGGEYSQTDIPMMSFGNILNQGAFDSSIDFNDPGRTDSLALQAMLAYRFYDGGKIQAGIDHSEANRRAANHELAAVRQQLAFEVVRRFFAIDKAREILMVSSSAVEAIEASLAVGRARYDVGDLLQEEVLNLELQLAREQESRLRAGHDHELAIKAFWTILGIAGDQEGILPAGVEPPSPPKRVEPAQRPELLVVDERIKAAQSLIDAAKSMERPIIDGYASYQQAYGTVLGESGDGWQAGVRLNYQLYNGRRTEGEIANARAQLAELQAMRQKVILALDLELHQARIGYQQSLEQLDLAEKMVTTAEESTRLSRSRFREGVILVSDLIDMEMRLTDARARMAKARADKAVAAANLRRAAGLGQFSETIGETDHPTPPNSQITQR